MHLLGEKAKCRVWRLVVGIIGAKKSHNLGDGDERALQVEEIGLGDKAAGHLYGFQRRAHIEEVVERKLFTTIDDSEKFVGLIEPTCDLVETRRKVNLGTMRSAKRADAPPLNFGSDGVESYLAFKIFRVNHSANLRR